MCFAFLTYFPAENLVSKTCVQYKDVDMCDVYSECNFTTLMDISNPSTAAMFDQGEQRKGHVFEKRARLQVSLRPNVEWFMCPNDK